MKLKQFKNPSGVAVGKRNGCFGNRERGNYCHVSKQPKFYHLHSSLMKSFPKIHSKVGFRKKSRVKPWKPWKLHKYITMSGGRKRHFPKVLNPVQITSVEMISASIGICCKNKLCRSKQSMNSQDGLALPCPITLPKVFQWRKKACVKIVLVPRIVVGLLFLFPAAPL